MDQSKIFEKYRDRLIDISGRNRTLILRKLYKKRSFDLSLLERYSPGTTEKIIAYLTGNSTAKVKILDDPYSLASKTQSNLNYNTLSQMEDSDNTIRSIQDEMISYSKSLDTLKKEISSIERETGRYELYVGYPFIEGKLNDGKTYIKSPIFLFSVALINEKNKWYIEKLKDEDVILNKVLLVTLSKHYDIDVENQEYDKGYSTEDILDFFDNLGITVEKNHENTVERFEEGQRDIQEGKFILRNFLILGNFHIANSIYNDYSKMLADNVSSDVISELLSGQKKDEINQGNLSTYDSDVDSYESIKEEDFFYISDLDYSQERAIKKVWNDDSLVIYGPPGTGKSQTITNIIADGLAKEKTILVVSEKRAALDVVYNRLSKISSKLVLIHDAQKGKIEFYDKLKTCIQDASLDQYNYEVRQAFEANSKKIHEFSNLVNKSIEDLEKLGESLYSTREIGLSLAQMYAINQRELSDSDMELFGSFRNHFSNCKVTYDVFNDKVSKIDEQLIRKYFRYKSYEEKFANIESVLNNKVMDSFEVAMYRTRLEKLLTDFNGKVQIICKNQYHMDIKNSILKGHKTEDALYNLSKEINERNNVDKIKKLRKLNSFKWWNILSILTKGTRTRKIKSIEEELENSRLEIYNSIKDQFNYVASASEKFNFLNKFLLDYQIFLIELIRNGKDMTKFIEDLIEYFKVYDDFTSLKLEFDDLDSFSIDILNFLHMTREKHSPTETCQKLSNFYLLHNILEIEKNEGKTINLYKSHNQIVKQTLKNMAEKRKIVPNYIKDTWDRKFRLLSSSSKNSKEFEHQAKKSRRLLSIRKLIEGFDDLIFTLFPCFLLTPEVVSEIIPLKKEMFDLVIFDEASQLFIEKAIPSIYRGKKIVVAGDDKQLRPTSVFLARAVDDLDEENYEYEEIQTVAALEEESLLDLAKVNFPHTYLQFHYRSSYRELIDFSNHAFYNARLYVSPNVNNSKDYRPIERIKVNGTWNNQTNSEEAMEVVKLVKNLLRTRKENETIGIITFNIKQKDLIDDLLEEETSKDEKFRELFLKEIDRMEDNEDKGLFVKNIENVQGDERDIIIFSTAYAKDSEGRFRFNFGSLSQDGGENRLNVAISRARKKIYVITSFEPEEFNVETTKNAGPKMFKEYMKYARAISERNISEANLILSSLSKNSTNERITLNFESIFEEQVYERLKKSSKIQRLNFDVHTQVESSGYRIDLAIYDPRTSKYILGIECDGATYHSSKSARERDIHRQKFLESKGWTIHRIWSKDWWQNPQKEIEKIEELLKNNAEILPGNTVKLNILEGQL